jgi:hypothetical protein
MQYSPSILPWQKDMSLQENQTVQNSNITIHISFFTMYKNPNTLEQQLEGNNKKHITRDF